MPPLKGLCYLTLLTLPLSAVAIDAGPASAQQQETEGWLLLQSRNKVASPKPQTATATERDLAMQRWLKKYKYEIPDFYDPDAGGKLETKN
ncbi:MULTISPECIES: DUF3613 domain-containing protein [unclassified Pseudomonas]|uniref:DUF3613 domain-containing protein n=1 Tax=unclassified Pseudomonas TaxID=196821 RepID=UPI000AA2D05E|nr:MULTISPECIES: DUF3613 domain-containing protein [unclassified Pseudomonas]MCR8933292.1 DUF3613 domain-containing protein [Pseudomonas sp. S11A4]MCR8976894.1 DUF3613 domain-containing protein [Pseudomonas sp. S11P7]